MKKKTCISCESKKLVNILSLGNLFVSDYIPQNASTKIPRYPLQLILCHNCFLLQLTKTPPPAKLYTDRYGYMSGINQTMKNELAEIVKEATKLHPVSSGDIVIDIGSNDKTLLSNYPDSIITVGFDPVKKFVKYYKRKHDVLISEFFNAASFQKRFGKKRAEIITAISMFYDLPHPNKFLEDIKRCLSQKGIFIIQQNYLATMLSQNAFDNIVHEHIEYYSLLSLTSLLTRHGLEIIDASVNDTNGGSFRTIVARKGEYTPSPSVMRLAKIEAKMQLGKRKPYLAFAKRIKKNAQKLVSFIKAEKKKGKTIYLYGASTRGNTLLQYAKLDRKLIAKAVERNPEKWGKIFAAVGIPIISEEQARKEQPDYLLVLPWFFKTEFLAREKAYLERGGTFIFPLPTMEIIGKKG